MKRCARLRIALAGRRHAPGRITDTRAQCNLQHSSAASYAVRFEHDAAGTERIGMGGNRIEVKDGVIEKWTRLERVNDWGLWRRMQLFPYRPRPTSGNHDVWRIHWGACERSRPACGKLIYIDQDGRVLARTQAKASLHVANYGGSVDLNVPRPKQAQRWGYLGADGCFLREPREVVFP